MKEKEFEKIFRDPGSLRSIGSPTVADIDDSWSEKNYGMSVFQAAITVETILFYHLLNHLSLNRSDKVRDKVREEIENWALGRLKDWCARLELFNEDELNKLQPLIEERNKIAHERGYLRRGKTDPEIRKKWGEIIKNVKAFVGAYGKVPIE